MSESSQVTVAAEPAWPHQLPCEHGQCDCSAPSVFYILLPQAPGAAVVLTLQKWCLQSHVASTATARGASFMCSPALLAQNTPFLMLSWVAVPCPTVPGRAASLRGLELPFHLGEAGTGKHCPAARHLQGNSCCKLPPFSLHLGGSRSSRRF